MPNFLLLLYLDEMSIAFCVLELSFVITGTNSKPALLLDEMRTSPVSAEQITHCFEYSLIPYIQWLPLYYHKFAGFFSLLPSPSKIWISWIFTIFQLNFNFVASASLLKGAQTNSPNVDFVSYQSNYFLVNQMNSSCWYFSFHFCFTWSAAFSGSWFSHQIVLSLTALVLGLS